MHQFELRQIQAVDAALAARRPLLVRGDPGTGKSQLARAAAKELERAFISHTVDARTESRDLLWHFDAVSRLAEAQLMGALHRSSAPANAGARSENTVASKQQEINERLAIKRFLHPRALWWAFDWEGALQQAQVAGLPSPPQPDGGDPSNGCLVLIDEIDKGEPDVPNGLLEALGAGRFTPQGWDEPVTAKGDIAPLVIITTNEERALPDAFVRRCLVLHLRLPDDGEELTLLLMARGRAHFIDLKVSDQVLEAAAALLIADRAHAKENNWRPLPGQAEYLDLLRVVTTRKETPKAQKDLLKDVGEFMLKKHLDAYQNSL
ncbi:MAG: MoxR family ATPase, partial [Nitrococcus sp.]|nr:MoxR family ATPase [Nitrococcus sp.]